MALVTTEFQLAAGLKTKDAQEQTSALVTAENVDFFQKRGGVGKVPGSSRQADTAPAQIDSIHYYEYFDSAGVFTRERLIFSNGTLYRVEDDQTLTSLKTGLVSGEPFTSLVYDNRIYFFSESNNPIRYDGSDVLNVGVRAPGQTRTSLDGFTDPDDYGISGSNTKAANTASQDGDAGSIQVNKVDTGTTDVTLTRTGVAYDLSSAPDNELRVFLNVPTGALGKVDTTTAVQIALGEVGLSDADVHNFGPGSLTEGWNLIVLDLANPDSQNGSGATLADVNEISYTIRLSSVAQTQSGFLWDFLHTIDDSTLTAALGGAGSVNAGDVSYRVTFVARDGIESNAGTTSNTVTSTGSQVNLTSIPTSSDAQVVARKIYRDFDSDATFRLVTTINDNVTTTFTDDVANSARGTTPPLADTNVDNTHPSRMLTAVLWNRYVIGIDSLNRFQVNISARDRPNAWPIKAPQVLDAKLTAIIPFVDSCILFGEDRLYQITGGSQGLASLRIDEVNPEIGCVGHRAATRVKNTAAWVSEDEIYIAGQGVAFPWAISSVIRDKIDALPKTEIQNAHCVHDKTRSRLLFFFRSTAGGAYDTCLSYNYGQTGAGVVSREGTGIDPQDLRVGRWSELKFPSTYDVTSSAIVESAADVKEVWIGTKDADGGIVYHLQDPDVTTWADGSATEEMTAVVETTSEQANPRSFEGRVWPRYATLSGESTAQSTWTLTLTTQHHVEGPDISTREYTITVGPGKTSRRIALSKQQGVALQVKLTNTSGEGGVLRSLRIDSIPRQARGIR